MASLSGVNAAVVVIVQPDSGDTTAYRLFVATAGAIGIFVSWHLRHIGFAQLHQDGYERHPDDPSLAFPGTEAPTPTDFLYFSFTIGTAFSTSDVTVLTSGARWVVTIHSIVSFLFNAVVVAVAYQVLQIVALS